MENRPLFLDNLMHEGRKFIPSEEAKRQAHLKNSEEYEQLYRQSIDDSDHFWLKQAHRLDWIDFPKMASRYQWNPDKRHINHTWFEDGKINVCYNCVDRHIHAGKGHKIAYIWQGDHPDEQHSITYEQLHSAVCRCANALRALGIRKGDRICIYLPMILELPIVMLACARIGAIHSVVFAGFSSESLVHRINDSSCRLVICANESMRGNKKIPLKEIVDEALSNTPSVEKVLVVRHTSDLCPMERGRDLWYDELVSQQPKECPIEELNAEDPLFILYTSGSTGKPKGVVHTQAGYLLHAALTHYCVFDIRDTDVYWCTADIGWVTGHSYVVYGPLANGCTSLIYEGTPLWPNPGRFWEIIDKYRVSIFYTAPTAIRTLIASGKDYPHDYDLSSLRLLGTVGEPINPDVWIWYYETVGKNHCSIVDTWWQTETGGILITPLIGGYPMKPGSAGRPFFGVDPVILKEDGTECAPNEGGSLCIRRPWPGIMRTTWGDHERFIDTYFTAFKGCYFTGDGCRQDLDGDYWLLGRIDDVVNISGHRIGTAEVESALVSHPSVAEAAVVPIPDEIKGQALYAFVTLTNQHEKSEELRIDLKQHVKHQIGSIAVPHEIQFAPNLPKTRSGKIMRRILRKIAEKQYDALGDISTLADPMIVNDLIAEHR